MSNVPESRREKHDFLASHHLIQLRRKITELAVNDFGYDKERLEKKIEKFENTFKDKEGAREAVERMRKKNEHYYADFVQEETIETRKILRNAVFEFEQGNSIFPSGDAKFMEYCERRKHFDNAIGWLNCLKQELQYIAETLPCDKNKYKNVSKEIDDEISLIKGTRRSANKFLKE